MGDRRAYPFIRIFGGKPFSVERAGMFVIVAVDAEQFPIAAIGRVVFVIMIFVVNRQFAQVFSGEITPAIPANPWKYLECLISIIYFFHCINGGNLELRSKQALLRFLELVIIPGFNQVSFRVTKID